MRPAPPPNKITKLQRHLLLGPRGYKEGPTSHLLVPIPWSHV